MKHESYVIGVIGAEVSDMEQRQLLSGIISRAQQYRAQTVVLSNLSNSGEQQAAYTENRIYELIASDAFDALILLSESFLDPQIKEKIRRQLDARPALPVLSVGAAMPELEPMRIPAVSTSDAADLEAVTDYLAEQCGCRRIAFLSGPLSLEVSRARLQGYRQALNRRGIPFDDSLVIEGNFWYNSGEQLAEEYLSGTRPEPDALICANDYMAFGLLDAFSAAGEDITKHFAVIGYEYIPERHLHTPLLTTYQRNRSALGASAVDILMRQLKNEPEQPFTPPEGKLIGGQTCPSVFSGAQQQEELTAARMLRQYADWNVRSEMESKLTECRSMEQYAEIMGEFLFMVRDAVDIVLCLFEDWFSPSGSAEHTLLCRNINHWADKTVYSVPKKELPGIVRRCKKAAAVYFSPVYFRKRLLGYCMVRYDKPDTYDDTFRHWMKSVSNGLEFLRLKGDVRYLLQCSTLSPSYDSMTGVFSAEGLRGAFQLMRNVQQSDTVTAIAFRFRFGENALSSTVRAKETVTCLMAAVGVMKRFHGQGGIIGRLSEFAFWLLFPVQEDAALLADAVRTELMSDADFLQYADGVQCLTEYRTVPSVQCDFSALAGEIGKALDAAEAEQNARARLPYYQALQKLHEAMYRGICREEQLRDAAETLHLNQNHFNRIYRQVFGVSFHQDQILARLRAAKHLLLTCDETAACIAERCGYTDSKYFIRQFSAETGCTPKQYRNRMREYLK